MRDTLAADALFFDLHDDPGQVALRGCPPANFEQMDARHAVVIAGYERSREGSIGDGTDEVVWWATRGGPQSMVWVVWLAPMRERMAPACGGA